MLKPKYLSRFKKDFKKYQHNQKVIEELNYVVAQLLTCKKLSEKYQDHDLSGEYVGFRECHVKPDVLLIYYFDKEFLYLVRVGSHSELF